MVSSVVSSRYARGQFPEAVDGFKKHAHGGWELECRSRDDA